jgi:hypothetical protein
VLIFKRSGSSYCLRTTQTVRRRLSSSSSSSSSCVLVSLSFDPFGCVLLVARNLADGPTDADGPWVEDGQSIFRGALLEVQEAISDSPR